MSNVATVKRWTAKRKAAVVIGIGRKPPDVMLLADQERWCLDFLSSAE